MAPKNSPESDRQKWPQQIAPKKTTSLMSTTPDDSGGSVGKL